MSITTLSETKKILQLTDTTYDSLILDLIPIVHSDIINYTNNKFLTDIYIYTSSIAFVDGSPATITDSDSNFLVNYLLNAKDILVEGSLYNDGYYKVHPTTVIIAGTITLASDESLFDEDESQSVSIMKIDFPDGIRGIAARMIGYKLSKVSDKGIKSERIGDYSVTFDDINGYPKSIINNLKTYRRLYA